MAAPGGKKSGAYAAYKKTLPLNWTKQPTHNAKFIKVLENLARNQHKQFFEHWNLLNVGDKSHKPHLTRRRPSINRIPRALHQKHPEDFASNQRHTNNNNNVVVVSPLRSSYENSQLLKHTMNPVFTPVFTASNPNNNNTVRHNYDNRSLNHSGIQWLEAAPSSAAQISRKNGSNSTTLFSNPPTTMNKQKYNRMPALAAASPPASAAASASDNPRYNLLSRRQKVVVGPFGVKPAQLFRKNGSNKMQTKNAKGKNATTLFSDPHINMRQQYNTKPALLPSINLLPKPRLPQLVNALGTASRKNGNKGNKNMQTKNAKGKNAKGKNANGKNANGTKPKGI